MVVGYSTQQFDDGIAQRQKRPRPGPARPDLHPAGRQHQLQLPLQLSFLASRLLKLLFTRRAN